MSDKGVLIELIKQYTYVFLMKYKLTQFPSDRFLVLVNNFFFKYKCIADLGQNTLILNIKVLRLVMQTQHIN